MHLRNLRKSSREISLYEPIGTDREGNEISLLDILGTDSEIVAEQVETRVFLEWLQQYVQTLPPKDQLVLRQRFGIGGGTRKTQRDIAKRLGISRSYVSRIEKRAILKILQDLERVPPREAADPEAPPQV